MIIYFDTGYPPKLVECVRLLYKNPGAPQIEIVHGNQLKLTQNKEDSVVFIFDHSKRGVSLATKQHAENGCKVFAFKKRREQPVSFFSFSLTILSAWRNILKQIENSDGPFLCTIYNGSTKVNENKF